MIIFTAGSKQKQAPKTILNSGFAHNIVKLKRLPQNQ
jgi:hypothetical protein